MADEPVTATPAAAAPSVSSPLSPPSPAPAPSAAAPSAPQPAPSASPQSTSAAPSPTPAPATKPDWLPDESFWDKDKGEVKGADLAQRYNEMATRIAADDVRKGALPAAPEAYKVELPADFKAPTGVEFKFDTTDPIIAQAQKWAHGAGLTQEQFQQSLGLYAAAKVGEQAQIDAARAKEIEKLGATASSRVDNVINWMKSVDGSADKADAKALAGMLVTAQHVAAFERLITKFGSQGTAPFSQQHRDRPANGKVSAEEYEKMSPAAKLDYSRSFDQKQFQN